MGRLQLADTNLTTSAGRPADVLVYDISLRSIGNASEFVQLSGAWPVVSRAATFRTELAAF